MSNDHIGEKDAMVSKAELNKLKYLLSEAVLANKRLRRSVIAIKGELEAIVQYMADKGYESKKYKSAVRSLDQATKAIEAWRSSNL